MRKELISIIIPIYADDEVEESNITEEELKKIIETKAETTEIPIINSKNAIIFDRTSRRSII